LKTIQDFRDYLNSTREELNIVRRAGPQAVNKWLMDYGNTLGVFPDLWKVKTNKVSGCSSNVFINGTLAGAGMIFMGDSDSKLIRGQMAILINGLNGLQPADILNNAESCLDKFVHDTNVRFSMTVNRTSSLGTLFKFIQQKTAELIA
jgi:cysteine desulfuration protein SufE